MDDGRLEAQINKFIDDDYTLIFDSQKQVRQQPSDSICEHYECMLSLSLTVIFDTLRKLFYIYIVIDRHSTPTILNQSS